MQIPQEVDNAGQPARVILLGTPAFAVPILETLLAMPTVAVVSVVTQPDRPAGRGRQLQPSPVKQAAKAAQIPVYQPERLRGAAVVEHLRALAPDLLVIAAYGQILRPAVLVVPRYGCLNVHPSLLPRHRGAAPIAAAILAGDGETGVTIMLTDAGMDTGPILTQTSVPMPPTATAAALTPYLATVGAQLLAETVPRWLAGQLTPQPQDETQATTSRMFVKSDGLVDWHQPAVQIARRIRALNPWPRAYTYADGQRLLLLNAQPAAAAELPHTNAPPGTIIAISSAGPVVQTGAGLLLVTELQPAGRRAMSGQDFVRGQGGLIGQHWHEEGK